MIVKGKRSNKTNTKDINIMEKNSWEKVNWDIYSAANSKNMNILFNNKKLNNNCKKKHNKIHKPKY